VLNGREEPREKILATHATQAAKREHVYWTASSQTQTSNENFTMVTTAVAALHFLFVGVLSLDRVVTFTLQQVWLFYLIWLDDPFRRSRHQRRSSADVVTSEGTLLQQLKDGSAASRA
jgi:hypothetical protein